MPGESNERRTNAFDDSAQTHPILAVCAACCASETLLLLVLWRSERIACITVSIGGASTVASSFPFLGTHYTAMNVCSNGYVTFGSSSASMVSEATQESHLSAGRGPSFSLLLTDLKVPNVHVSHLERVIGSRTVPYATVVTYKDARAPAGETGGGVSAYSLTAQAFFEHDTGAVTILFGGSLPSEIDAIVGPSAGSQAGVADVTKITQLLGGHLAAVGGSANVLCGKNASPPI